MKKFLVILSFALASIGSYAYPHTKLDEGFKASFKSHFPNAQEVTWQERPSALEVQFVDAGIRMRIVYGKDQSYVTITRYYQPSNLPFDIDYILTKELPEKKIFNATEVTTILEPQSQLTKEYFLTMQDETKWYIIKMTADGNYRIVKKFGKA